MVLLNMLLNVKWVFLSVAQLDNDVCVYMEWVFL